MTGFVQFLFNILDKLGPRTVWGLKAQAGEKYLNPLCGRLFLKGQLPELLMNPSYRKNDPFPIDGQVWMIPLLDIVKII